jgi:hypothetical protein
MIPHRELLEHALVGYQIRHAEIERAMAGLRARIANEQEPAQRGSVKTTAAPAAFEPGGPRGDCCRDEKTMREISPPESAWQTLGATLN